MRTLRLIGPGRAGRSIASALVGTGSWELTGAIRRGEPLSGAARGVDLVVISTPDASIAGVAASVEPADAVVCHLAGSLGTDVLATHPEDKRAAIHPLVALPNPEVGAGRLARGAWFAVAGHPIARQVVEDLGGRWFSVEDQHRAEYHAAACIASNHLVALLGQVERVASSAGVPLEAYLDLVRSTIDNVSELGPADALTGPAARGDWATIARHREALSRTDPSELEAYDAMVKLARRLVGDPGPLPP